MNIRRFLLEGYRSVSSQFHFPRRIILGYNYKHRSIKTVRRICTTVAGRQTYGIPIMSNIMRLQAGTSVPDEGTIVNGTVHKTRDEAWSVAVDVAANCLLEGGVVAVPTDTIYGIACLSQNDAAVERVYAIKGRDPLKPLAICVSDVQDVYRWATVTISDQLLRSLLPGPVTVLFQRSAALNPLLNPGTSLVGIRVPDSGFIRDICRLCSEPLALTSANVSSQPSSLSIQGFQDIWPRLDHIFDGGYIGTSQNSSSGSTIVDLSVYGVYTIVRTGSAYSETIVTLMEHGLRESEARST